MTKGREHRVRVAIRVSLAAVACCLTASRAAVAAADTIQVTTQLDKTSPALGFGDARCPGIHVDPKLGPLGDNGGPTQTMALLAGSPAIGLVLAGSGSSPVAVSVALTGLSPATTYHAQVIATNPDGSSSSSDLTFTTPAAGGTTPTTSSTAPVLSGARQSARRWLEGNLPARISANRRLPVATTFSFVLNEPATVALAFTQTIRGRGVRGGCVAATRCNTHKTCCSQMVTRGELTFTGHAGVNRIRFQGRLARGRRVKPGTYTLVITAAIAGQPRSAAARLTFTIVARAP